MTVEAKIRSDESYMEDITRRLAEKKELTPEQISFLKENGKWGDPSESNKSDEIIGPVLEKALKRIELNLILSTNSPADTLDVIKNIYQGYMKNRTSKKQYNWPYELRRYAYKLKHARSDFNNNDYFFGWLLIRTTKIKEIKDRQGLFEILVKGKNPIKRDWRTACDLMYRVSGISKYLDDYDSRNNRNHIYKLGMKNIKIVCRAYGLKLFLEGLNKVGENITTKLNGADPKFLKALKRFGYNANLTKKIYTLLSNRYFEEGENSTKIGDIYDRFSNKRLEKDILPCVRFLERNGLILFLEKNKIDKEIYFLVRGKNLEDALPFWVYPSVFGTKKVFKEFSSHF